jgi:hypothetical protein
MANIQDRTERLQEMLQRRPSADWVRQMIDYYRRTGAYRSEDLHRLLGDQTQGVKVSPRSCLASQLNRLDRSS